MARGPPSRPSPRDGGLQWPGGGPPGPPWVACVRGYMSPAPRGSRRPPVCVASPLGRLLRRWGPWRLAGRPRGVVLHPC
eukprot:12070988-Alexandrium_andersonii.AAC.1